MIGLPVYTIEAKPVVIKKLHPKRQRAWNRWEGRLVFCPNSADTREEALTNHRRSLGLEDEEVA